MISTPVTPLTLPEWQQAYRDGASPAALLGALRGRLAARQRDAAVIRLISDAELHRLDRAGVRGVRFNVLFKGGTPLAKARSIAQRIRPLGWHVQLLIDVSAESSLYDDWKDFPVPVVVDHMGHLDARLGVSSRPGQGSTFTLCLPVARLVPDSAPAPVAVAQQPADATAAATQESAATVPHDIHPDHDNGSPAAGHA